MEIDLKLVMFYHLIKVKISKNLFLKNELIPKYEDELILRVLLSSQYKEFSKIELEKFFSNTYLVTKRV